MNSALASSSTSPVHSAFSPQRLHHVLGVPRPLPRLPTRAMKKSQSRVFAPQVLLPPPAPRLVPMMVPTSGDGTSPSTTQDPSPFPLTPPNSGSSCINSSSPPPLERLTTKGTWSVLNKQGPQHFTFQDSASPTGLPPVGRRTSVFTTAPRKRALRRDAFQSPLAHPQKRVKANPSLSSSLLSHSEWMLRYQMDHTLLSTSVTTDSQTYIFRDAENKLQETWTFQTSNYGHGRLTSFSTALVLPHPTQDEFIGSGTKTVEPERVPSPPTLSRTTSPYWSIPLCPIEPCLLTARETTEPSSSTLPVKMGSRTKSTTTHSRHLKIE